MKVNPWWYRRDGVLRIQGRWIRMQVKSTTMARSQLDERYIGRLICLPNANQRERMREVSDVLSLKPPIKNASIGWKAPNSEHHTLKRWQRLSCAAYWRKFISRWEQNRWSESVPVVHSSAQQRLVGEVSDASWHSITGDIRTISSGGSCNGGRLEEATHVDHRQKRFQRRLQRRWNRSFLQSLTRPLLVFGWRGMQSRQAF